ncbi:MAG: hypothetical protein LBC46_03190 [Treponema sp.]|jgi:NhaP-type Na+/H+ or K+/H+ antiporter|nr:hypothetical protein [Treponema sp.]
MDKFWSLFWKLFGVSLLVAFAIGIILGIAQHSIAIVYSFGQAILASGLGISGIIGLFVMPVQLYLEYRSSHKEVKE